MNHSFAAIVAIAIAASAVACSAGESGGPTPEELGTAVEPLTNVCPPADNVLGIDIASFQHPGGAAIDWKQVATARKFTFVKATEGAHYANTYYPGDVAGARAAGLMVGAYGVVAPFSKTGDSGKVQAEYFLAHSGIKAGDLPPLLDVEPFAEYGSVLPELSTITEWLTTVTAALGRKPTVYIRPDLIAELGTPASLGAYTIDVPNYSNCPGYPNSYPLKNLVMWQYTDNAAVPGIHGAVDGIRFYGDLAALETFAAGTPAIPPATGVLDKVACDGIAGWDWDPNQKPKSTTVKISYDGVLGAAGSAVVTYPAADNRPDLCTAIGSCPHGFSVLPPRSLFDTKPHTVDAYAVSLEAGGPGDRLTSSPKTLTCAELPIAAGAVKRWITNPTVLAAWKFDRFTDLAPETDAVLDPVTKGADLTAPPQCVRGDDGSAAIWIIDQGKRRHVVSPTSLTAWRLTATTLAAATLNAYPQGPNWPDAPELAKGTSAEVYVLDVPIDSPIVPVGDGTDPPAGTAPGDNASPADPGAPSDASGGCQVGLGGHGADPWTALAGLGGAVLVLGRGRRRRALAVLAVVGAFLALPSAASAAVTHPFNGVTEVNHGDRVLVIADLCAAGVTMRATKYGERDATPSQWATKAAVNADIAVNADFFDFPGWTYVVGRARGGGEDWPAGDQNKETRSYWQFGPGLAALVEPSTTAPTAGVTDVVGGHNVLIRNGKSLAPNFDGDSVITTSHRRTAIGVDATHEHVYLFASDASLDGTGVVGSVVAMAAEGGAPALAFLTNQDGGGSSQMYIRGQGQPIDSGRPVNNHLGIIARGTGAAPMCPNRAPRGRLDGALCTTITGWAQDEDVPTQSIGVHLYFDKPSGTAGANVVATVADVDRPDLATPIGSTKHGYVVDAPYGIFDGKVHTVFSYALDSKGGTDPLLGQKTMTCPASAPASIRRHVSSPAVLAAWKLDLFTDAMPLGDATLDGFAPGTDLAAAPVLIRADDGSAEVWLVDGPYRRHVVDRASADAWHLDLTKVTTTPAAAVDAMLHGPDLRARPLLGRVTTGAVYVLDDPASLPPGATIGPDGGVVVPPSDGSSGSTGTADGGADGAAPGDDAGGCAVGQRSSSTGGVLLGALALLVLRARRRRER